MAGIPVTLDSRPRPSVHEELFDDRLDEQGRPTRAAFVTDPDGNVVELWTWDVARHLADVEPRK
jgi:hypothetical protein